MTTLNPFEAIHNSIEELKQQNQQILSFLNDPGSLERSKPLRDKVSALEILEEIPSNPKLATLYQWTHKKQIPFTRHGKKLVFSRELVRKWVESNYPKNEGAL